MNNTDLELQVVDPTIQQASVRLRWCVKRSFLDTLKIEDGEKLFVLIILKGDLGSYYGDPWYEYHSERRQLLPLERMSAFIQLQKPGEFEVVSILLKGSRGQLEKIKTRAYHRDGSRRHDEELLAKGSAYCAVTTLKLNVPEGCSAPEPSKFEKWWVNFLFRDAPRDECVLRRRRILAYTFQPVVLLVWFLGVTTFRFLLAFVLMVVGQWNIDWYPVAHPFSAGTKEITKDSSNVFPGLWNWVILRVFGPPKTTVEERQATIEERKRREAEAEMLRQRILYRRASCEFMSKSPIALAPWVEKIELIYEAGKARLCRPFAK